MANNYDNIPDELKSLKQWVVWRLEERENTKGEMKPTKIPYKTQTAKAATTRKDEWMYFNAALEMLESTRKMAKWYDGCKLSEVGLNGLGFVFTDGDEYLGIDWDHIRDAETGEIEEQYIDEMTALDTYCEISQSGEGAHAICKGTIEGTKHRKVNTPYEMYESKRFFVMTGNHIKNTPTEVRESPNEAIKAIYDKIDPPKEDKKPVEKVETKRIEDQDIIELCRSASNADKFNSLYNGNVGGYGGDHSAADMALCSIIAFYTQDEGQIERIFKGSGLVRDKWNREDYKNRTIENAISGLSETYTPKHEGIKSESPNEHEPKKEIYEPHIIKLANKLLDRGDSFRFIIDTWNKLHIGDKTIGQACACTVAATYMTNTSSLNMKPSGSSGKGKSDASKKFLHLLPSHMYKVGSISGKAMFYDDSLKKGTIIYTDDVLLNDDIVSMIKQATTNYQEETLHTTVVKQKVKSFIIPPRVSWWMTSVDGFDDDQMGNRFLGVDVDGSTKQDHAVLEHQKKAERMGITNVTIDDNIMICRCMFDILRADEYKIIFPYTECLEWNNVDNRRNFPMFLDIIKAVTLFNVKQREKFEDCYLSTEDDFDRAKEIYRGMAESNATNLTATELKIMRWIGDREHATIQEIASLISKGETTARNILNGRDGKGGMLLKVKGLKSDRISESGLDDKTIHRVIYSYNAKYGLNTYADVVTLKCDNMKLELGKFKNDYVKENYISVNDLETSLNVYMN